MKFDLTSREQGLIAECLLIVSKLNTVGAEQMKELLALMDKLKPGVENQEQTPSK